MKSIVLYASHKGNTRRIAEEMAAVLKDLGDVTLLDVTEAPDHLPAADLVLIGGPTERHTMTTEMSEYLRRLEPEPLISAHVATFDTRVAWPEIVSGSAANSMAMTLEASGIRLCAAPESFIVTMEPQLRPGELERAAKWALHVAATIAAREPVAVAG
jgi:flavodoxin